ncbi:HET-domain-containing protein [Hypoxylon sp. FL1857]|nr:HET-domain-containing protein [Hypoxylon sp. FL1857]
MSSKYHYEPLLNKDIRVIQLLTRVDDPIHADGPVHCRIVHVSLDDSHRVDGPNSLTKGSNGVWPVSVDGAADSGFDELFDKSLFECIFPLASTPDVKYFEGPKFLDSNTSRVSQTVPTWDPSKDEEAELPWRYTWGDFVALSYVWGDQSIRAKIYVDDVPVSVTASLEGALRKLREHSRIQQGFFVWVDALCINQEDLDERSAQVARMKEIYHNAWRVVIWLGPEDHHSDLAMLALRYMSLHSQEEDILSKLYKRVQFYVVRLPFMQWQHTHTTLRIRKVVLNAIYHLLARPYWRRLWIIQEIVLGSRDSPVLCGSSSILLRDIINALKTMEADGDALGQYVIFSARGMGQTKLKWSPMGDDMYDISEKLWERPVAVTALQALDTNLSKSNRGVYDALLLSREAKATDERDRVYGILGLPQVAHVVKLIPDYNRKALETFVLFSSHLLASGNLNGLRLVDSPVPSIGTRYLKSDNFSRPRSPKFIRRHRVIHRGCEHNLPSWVICWSCPPNPAQPFPDPSISLPNPPSMLSITPQITDSTLLTVKGIIFDTITGLSAFHATESDKSYPHNAPDPAASPYGSRDSTRLAVARLLIGNNADGPDASVILHPKIWDTGIMGVDNNIFGVKDFYFRNRRWRLFDEWTIESLIREEKAGYGVRVRENASTRRRILAVTAAHREALNTAMKMLAWRRLVTTQNGYMALVPAATRAGDVIAVLIGCDAPLVLRPDGEGRFSIVGEAYVQWVTGQELQEGLKENIYTMENIFIH